MAGLVKWLVRQDARGVNYKFMADINTTTSLLPPTDSV
jgi:hypothetical protein